MNTPPGPSSPALSLHEVLDQFKRALRAAGLDTDEALVADGELHRYRVEGDKKGSKNGFYVLHADGIPAGEFGSWKTGQKETWRADIGRTLSSEEEAAHKARVQAMQAARKLAEGKARAEARSKAARLWKAAAELVKATHPYLVAKVVRAYGIRQLKDALMVPMRDVDGALHGLQFIQPDGTKRFTTGMAKAGHYRAIGKPQGVVLIAEGYATAATLHEATGHALACAFDAGNLLAVAQAIHAKRPELRLVLAADNDHRTEGNPGLAKAQVAAAAVHGLVCLPAFAADAEGTDWNDYAALHGLAAVCEAVAAQMAAGGPAGLPDVAQRSGAVDAGTSTDDAVTASAEAEPEAGSGKVLPFPAKGRSKGCSTAGGDAPETGAGAARGGRGGTPAPARAHFTCDGEAVWWHDLDKEGVPMAAYWVCPPLDVRAYLRDVQGENWGRLLVFNDKDGREHRWGMPMRLLAGGCDEMRGELLRLGFDVPTAAKNRTLLVNYIQRAKPDVFARCVERTGWHDRVFVFPDHTIGETDELVLFQSESATPTHYRTRGALAHWRSDVAELCRGNSRLMFGVCVAFAGPLLAWAGEESGGFNIRGASSTGKSVSLHLAASVWGGPDFRKKWRTTDNAMESLAALHTDTVLPLDEMGEIDARIVGETVYMLAGGEGKARAGGLRHTPTWRVVFLSTSEISLAEHMRQGGKKVQAGQDARVADVPADAGAGHGVFEALHGYNSGVKLAEATKRLTGEQYGHAGPAFLQGMLRRLDTLPDVLRAQRDAFRAAHLPKSASGQSLRVAGRFALVAAAGELATEVGITGWEEGEATAAVARCMKDWAEERGGVGNLEPVRMVEQVRHFLYAHGTARFPMIGDGEKEGWVTVNQAGFREASVMSEMSYYVFAEVFEQQVCEGFDARAVARQLKVIGALRTDGQRLKVSKRLPGKGLVRCYHILPDIWEDAADDLGKAA